ncbi:MAG: DHH family phosphoesterase [Oscillospiraceae bacterium]|nr:DHH family phosphoesterase [Oscillospiraceae bacterium]
MTVSLETFAEKLLAADDLCIVYHIRPDGDCIGSAFALALALKAAGKRCTVTGRDPVPNIHRYLTDRVPLDEIADPVYFTLDAVSPYRTGNFADQHFTFCIDHHRNNSIEADYKYVEEDCGACSEIIFKLICAMKIPVTKEIADLLYTALITDTQRFRTSDTTAQSFETAAALTRLGADIFGISRRNTFVKPRGRRMIEDALRESLHITHDGRLMTGIITQADLRRAEIEDSELEGINSFVEQYEEMLIGVTVRELPDGRSRCSMRTGGDISAAAICALHGGGGHYHAAVCELDEPPELAREIMEQTCAGYLPEE